ncbi:MAG TPA: beta-ketoacyl synthase N-terminal-like domain-containing protein [Blastocatellia bacterium]|nr:beta-ketoacyl synthase N-terminal-like domain-containing protein [Blastocatellia bacterium]
MTDRIHIVSVGARTPLGLRAASAAAIRAGITALGEHPFMVDRVGERMPGALDARLDPEIIGPERFLALIETALREACAPLAELQEPPPRLPLFLGLPEQRPGFTELDARQIQSGLGRFQKLPIQISEISLSLQGHSAGWSALAQAVEQMRQGPCQACLVGGAESYFHPDTMEWLDANRQLVGTVSRSGFVPGEGAGICLLMTEPACRRWGLQSLASIRAVAIGRETKLIKTEDLCLGEGLSATVWETVSGLQLPAERINDIYCDMNSERYRGEEWGFVCLRLAQYFDNPTVYRSPAESWGDMGAASGPLFAMLACQAAARGYALGPRVMLWASSEGGQRGSAVLETINT